ncbi:MAG: CPBP family glutamic-type intramembrane protease [Chlorobiales bacterium]|nr:CPBP family glutamic-type intramembrane protease [Chlorobiales bacterium]
MRSVKTLPAVTAGEQERLRLSLGLMVLIWMTGFIGYFTPLTEWPALYLYLSGSLGLVLYRGIHHGDWVKMYLAGGNLKKSLFWGAIAGAVLFLMDIVNTVMYYKNGGTPMAEMEILLVGRSLIYFFPLLILAEEFLWRGIMFSSMVDRRFNGHLTVFLTAIFYTLNHFAVAPVGMFERALMAMMAFPIGIIGGYIVLKTRNLWGSVLMHAITMISMLLDIFIVPKLVFG